MSALRQAAQQALDALESYDQYIHPLTNYFGGPEVPREGSTSAKVEDAITALRAALAEQEQEPVAWRYEDSRGNYRYRKYVSGFDDDYSILKPVPLYTAPPQRPPHTLTCVCGAEWDIDSNGEEMLAVAPPKRPLLTDEEISDVWCKHYREGFGHEQMLELIRAIERKVRGE